MLDLTGKTLKGRYRIEALVGRGGMAKEFEFVRCFRREVEALDMRTGRFGSYCQKLL